MSKRQKVLIVDDNATSRMILSKQLDKWGIQTAAVGSAAEAIALQRARLGGV